MKKLWVWLLIVIAAGIAFYTSFRNSIDMASMTVCDDGNMLVVTVLNEKPKSPSEPLLLKVDYVNQEEALKSGAGRKAFPQPFSGVLVASGNRIVARLGTPDELGNLPGIPNIPHDEKYFWVGFPQVKVDGNPASLLIKNPFYGMESR